MHIPNRYTARWLKPLGLLAVTLLVAACGADKDKRAQIRLLNASPELASAELVIDKDKLAGPVSALTLSAYARRGDGTASLQVRNSSGGATVATSPATLKADAHYTLIAYGAGGAMRTSLVEEEQAEPASGQSKLMVLNLAPDAGPVDVFLTDANAALASAQPFASNVAPGQGSGFLARDSGSYRLRVTGAGKRDDVRLDLAAVTLDSAKVSTLVLRGSAGGVLVHALKLPQRGELSRMDNGSARVRVVAAISAGRIDASIAAQSLLENSRSPAIGPYRTVPAGTQVPSITVDGIAVAPTLPSLVAGGDYTLLLRGTAAAPVMQALVDDNRLPTVSGQARLNLVNGLDLPASLNFNYSPVTQAIGPGGTGSANVAATNAALVSVTSSQFSDPLYTQRDLAVSAEGVYSLFLVNADSPQGIVRRER